MNAQTTSAQDGGQKSLPSEHLLKELQKGVVNVGDLPVVVYCPTTYSGSDMGFHKYEWSIKVIYNRNRQHLKPVFDDEWKEIAPGIATANRIKTESSRYGNCKQAIRIERHACPVRVVFRYVHEYNDYDDYKECGYREDTVETIFQAAEET